MPWPPSRGRVCVAGCDRRDRRWKFSQCAAQRPWRRSSDGMLRAREGFALGDKALRSGRIDDYDGRLALLSRALPEDLTNRGALVGEGAGLGKRCKALERALAFAGRVYRRPEQIAAGPARTSAGSTRRCKPWTAPWRLSPDHVSGRWPVRARCLAK